MNTKRWIASAIAAVIVIIAIPIQIVTAVLTAEGSEWLSFDQMYNKEVMKNGSNGEIVVLELDGVIEDTGGNNGFFSVGYHHRQFLEMLEDAMEDPLVDGIVITVNTPGGSVVASNAIYEQVVRSKEEFDTPVYVSMGEMAASGGYYIAAGADYIMAHPATLTGSIGTVMSAGLNFADLAEEWGISETSVSSGEYKQMGSPFQTLSEEEEALLQEISDDMYEDFTAVVAEGRGFSDEEIDTLAQGQLFTGNQALENGLVDELGDLRDAVSHMELMLDLDATVTHYTSGSTVGSMWNVVAPMASKDPVSTILEESRATRMLYLHQ
ncbi:signal peptide peptidase SppA [Geomicrobium sp. JCM 19055]|uniref:signal peptide peptidase SppA n=1 Tax=Geomicrobium sp. JCM 19055 TaxID=1460649 RepID=UPI00045EDD3B|nr:signal peptide peptidase SppA [Geomicrobium sp. JCM 19055]GAJ97707.1 protease IV [Geomicrobium sp. JCM 19055]